MKKSGSLQWSASGLAFLSGMAGLGHQVIWTRRLVDLLGASPLTFSKVVGAFLVGLTLGALIASRESTASQGWWRRVAGAECAVAILALPILCSVVMGPIMFENLTVGKWSKLILPFLLVTPPALAMGVVIPWIIRAVQSSGGMPRSFPLRLYAINTLGGVLGIGLVLLFALPRFGLTATGLSVGGLNLSVAAGALALALRHRSAKTAQEDQERVIPLPANYKLLAFCSGFSVLSLEVILQHQFSQITINSLYSSATVLAWVLIALTVSAALVPFLSKSIGSQHKVINFALVAAILGCAAEPFLLTGLRKGVNILAYELSPAAYTWEICKLGLLAICPLMIPAGLLFPMILHASAGNETGGTGRKVALLLAWNGFGGWLGTELTQFVTAPQFGLWRSVTVIGFVYLLLYVARLKPILVQKESRFIRLRFLVPSVLVVLAFVFARFLPQATTGEGERLAALEVGREGVVATIECGPGDWRILFNNSYTLGGSKAQSNQERQAHVPILLHGSAKTVGLLGVATGSTVAGASLHPGVARIDAAELSPLVLQFARQHFEPYNRSVFHDPHVHFLQEDARWVIACQKQTYDVVVGDLFLPWRTGEGRLFTLEHFQAVRRALKPDGLFCQWLPMFQLTRPQFETIIRTFQKVFSDAFLVRGDFYTELPILGLVGGRSLSSIDWTKVRDGCIALQNTGKVTDPLVRHPEGLAMMIIGALPASVQGPVNTLANSWLEWNAAQNILGLRTPWFIGVPCAEYIRDIHRSGMTLMPEALQSSHDAGQFFLTLEIAARMNLPVLSNLKLQVPGRLPKAMLQDAEANWQQWPMRIKPDRHQRLAD